jgi:hypothetical protein
MNMEIGAEAALFPEKECINGIAVAVYCLSPHVYIFPCRIIFYVYLYLLYIPLYPISPLSINIIPLSVGVYLSLSC